MTVRSSGAAWAGSGASPRPDQLPALKDYRSRSGSRSPPCYSGFDRLQQLRSDLQAAELFQLPNLKHELLGRNLLEDGAENLREFSHQPRLILNLAHSAEPIGQQRLVAFLLPSG